MYQLLISYANKYGINDLIIARIARGYSIEKTFTGKTAIKRAQAYINKLENKS